MGEPHDDDRDDDGDGAGDEAKYTALEEDCRYQCDDIVVVVAHADVLSVAFDTSHAPLQVPDEVSEDHPTF